MTFLPLNEPSLGDSEREIVLRTIDEGFVSTAGPIVAEFEETFAKAVGSAHAVAVSSGTAALHLSFLALNLGRGDLVAVSDLTFIASANAAAYVGADLLLVGPTPTTWNLDTELLYEEITRRAKAGEQLPSALEPVHILGHPADWEPLAAIRAEFGIPIIEDASEALGARQLVGEALRDTGTNGDLGCFSFNGNKMITTGGGGMVVTDDGALAERVRHLSTQAKLAGVGYQHDEIGFNYRMPALSAALGLAQLQRLDDFLEAKMRVRLAYEDALRDSPIELAPAADWAEPSHWLVSARLRAASDGPSCRDRMVEKLNAAGIGARPIWSPMHRQLPYAAAPLIGEQASAHLADTALSLPSSPSLTSGDVQRVADELLRATV